MTEQLAKKLNDSEGELHFLNHHHSFPLEGWEGSEHPDAASVWKRIKHALRNRMRKFVLGSLLGDYLQREQEYQAHLVRLLNHGKSTFDAEVHGLRHALAVHEQRLKTAEAVIRGLERIIAVAGKEASSVETQGKNTVRIEKDYSYLLLENRFRGSEEDIQARLSAYVPKLREAPGTVLEIGSGRGELLRLLKQENIAGYGIELDAAMVERATSLGLDVRLENGIEHLERSADSTFGAVVAIQVLEHLSYELLLEFLRLSRKKLRPGGLVIAETIDTSSLVALSQNYFRDPTHSAPLHPETLSYLFELSGLEVLEVERLSAFPPGFELQKSTESIADPQARAAVRTQNENVDKLNRLLYGFQDYAVIARVPS